MTSDKPGTDVMFATASLKERYEWARVIAGAGALVPKGFREPNGDANPSKVLLAAETGLMLGIHPIAALQGIHVIEGKPTISAGLMSALVRRAGHKLRVTTRGSVKDGTFEAIAELIRHDDPSFTYRSVWGLERATRAGLMGKQVWKNYFESMAKSRAISEVTKEGAEDVLMGNVYTPEEFDAPVNEQGEVIEDAEIVEQDHDGPNVVATMQDTSPEAQQRIADAVKADGDRVTNTDDLNRLWAYAKQHGHLTYVTSAGTELGAELLERGRVLKEQAVQASAPKPDVEPEDETPF